jgi:hypothetical protein
MPLDFPVDAAIYAGIEAKDKDNVRYLKRTAVARCSDFVLFSGRWSFLPKISAAPHNAILRSARISLAEYAVSGAHDFGNWFATFR